MAKKATAQVIPERQMAGKEQKTLEKTQQEVARRRDRAQRRSLKSGDVVVTGRWGKQHQETWADAAATGHADVNAIQVGRSTQDAEWQWQQATGYAMPVNTLITEGRGFSVTADA